jgi:hypothetical protein
MHQGRGLVERDEAGVREDTKGTAVYVTDLGLIWVFQT